MFFLYELKLVGICRWIGDLLNREIIGIFELVVFICFYFMLCVIENRNKECVFGWNLILDNFVVSNDNFCFCCLGGIK